MNPIDKLQLKLESSIQLAAAVIEGPYVVDIIKFCQLIPRNINSKKINYYLPTKFYPYWSDQYGNSLRIRRSKKECETIFHDLTVNRHLLYNRDMYAGLPMNKVIKISKLLYFFSGKEEDFNEEHYILSFLGIDNKLRTYVYMYGEWSQYPSLTLGIQTLHQISKNKDLFGYKKLRNSRRVIYSCSEQNGWVSSLPLSQNMIGIIEGENKNILDLINI